MEKAYRMCHGQDTVTSKILVNNNVKPLDKHGEKII